MDAPAATSEFNASNSLIARANASAVPAVAMSLVREGEMPKIIGDFSAFDVE